MVALLILNKELNALELKRRNLIIRASAINQITDRQDFIKKQLDDLNNEIDCILFAIDMLEFRMNSNSEV